VKCTENVLNLSVAKVAVNKMNNYYKGMITMNIDKEKLLRVATIISCTAIENFIKKTDLDSYTVIVNKLPHERTDIVSNHALAVYKVLSENEKALDKLINNINESAVFH